MKIKALFAQIVLMLGSVWAVSCSQWEEERPSFPDVPDPLVEWNRDLVLNGPGSVVFKADSGFPGDKPYTLNVSGAKQGTVRLEAEGRVRYSIDHRRWTRDSFTVQICRNGVCREWQRRVVNQNPVLADTLVLTAELRPYSLLYGSTLNRKLVPDNLTGKLIRIRHRFYTASILGPDSVRMRYFSGGGGTVHTYGYDDIEYLIRGENEQYIRGNFALVLGDTTEAMARPDSFTVPAGQEVITLNGAQIWNNDQNEDGSETQFQIRIQEDPSYGNELETTVPDGRLRDFREGGIQKIRFTRTNPQAQTITLRYYLRAGGNQRITRSTLRLRFL